MATSHSERSVQPSLAKKLTRRLEVRMALLTLAIAAILSLLSPYFLTHSNVFNMLDQSVVIGIISVGMTFVILTGGIDLSVGSVAGLTGIILGLALQQMPIVPAIGLAVLCGAFIGLVSGILINVFGLAAFVVTLGVMAIARSLAYIFSGQTAISNIPEDMQNIVYTSVLGIPTNVLFLLVLYLLAWAYLTYTKGGRTIYAVGSNKEAARAAGLNTLFYSVLPYVLSAALSAVAITFSISQLLSADPLMGNQMELDAIAGGGDRRRQPLWRPRLDDRHAVRRLHHGHDPQRIESHGRLSLLAGLGDRHDHHRGAARGALRLGAGEPMSTPLPRRPSLRHGRTGRPAADPEGRRAYRRVRCRQSPPHPLRRRRDHPRRLLHRPRPQLGHLQPRPLEPRRRRAGGRLHGQL